MNQCGIFGTYVSFFEADFGTHFGYISRFTNVVSDF